MSGAESKSVSAMAAQVLRGFLQPLLAVALGLALGLGVAMIAGESPWRVLEILIHGAFGSPYNLGMTLFYATPLIFTGLSVSFAFQAGLFNIGAEGQLLWGSLAAAAVGALFPGVPAPLAPIIAVLAAFLAGGAWGAIPGALRAYRGSHEVINTIMLNFIAAGLTAWVTLYLLPNPATQNPETAPIADSYRLAQLAAFVPAPVSVAFFIALGAAFVVWLVLFKTVFGYELRATGQNEAAARAAGIDTRRIQFAAMSIAGALAGGVALAEVLGNAGKFRMGFSPEYGFIGIAVALLGRNRPLGIVAAALLFGALHKGTGDLDLETEHITRDLSMILQAFVILSVTANGLWVWLRRQSPRRGPRRGAHSARPASKGAP